MFIRFPNTPPGYCLPGGGGGGQPVYTVSEPTSRVLFARAAACLLTYLKVSTGDWWPRMQPVYTVSNPTYREMSVKGAACLYGFKTYLTVTVGWGCSQSIISEPI